MKHRLLCLFTAVALAVCWCASAAALEAATLHNGSRGEAVRALQQALIDLGYLKGKADGIFGNQTENAVRAFQAAKKLTADGLAGKKTQALLFASSSAVSQPAVSEPAVQPAASEPAAPQSSSSVSVSDGNLFSGNYGTLRLKDKGARVKALQQALIRLNYLSGKADGIFGKKTLDAVIAFQIDQKLSADGLAGKKTLKALETADKNGTVRGASAVSDPTPASAQEESAPASSEPAVSPVSPSSVKTGTAPDGSTIRLLHWFNDIKPALKNGEHLLIYDPATGISWTLRIHSRGRHCDSEPLTAQDTENMVKAFGGKNTWDQKGVYVRLPSGIWTIGSTHDMPHMSGTISDNNFNGHLCVHFLRDMAEAKENDPKYGVANQETIRALWKSITGEDIAN